MILRPPGINDYNEEGLGNKSEPDEMNDERMEEMFSDLVYLEHKIRSLKKEKKIEEDEVNWGMFEGMIKANNRIRELRINEKSSWLRDRMEDRMLDEHYTSWEKHQGSERVLKITEDVIMMMKNVWISETGLPEDDEEMRSQEIGMMIDP